MRTPTTLVRVTAPLVAILVLSACSDGDGEQLASIGLDEQSADPDGSADDDRSGTDAPEHDATEQEGTDDSSDAVDTATGTSDGDVVDLTEAVPGTWPVGDAGTVTFSLVDGALVLDDVTANDGWMMAIDEQDPDEIEVDFTRDNVEWQIEIEVEDDGRILAIEIDQDIEPADTGSYDIGDAGTFAFSVVDGRLVLDDLSIADDWTLVELDEEADEIEFELANGPRSFDVEVELEDDGTIELEIDYEVTGQRNG
jgi:hypothetical protein